MTVAVKKVKRSRSQTGLETKFEVSNSRNKDFGIMVPAFYLKYAIKGFKMSS